MNTIGNIPGPSAPFLDSDGRISQAWWQFMISMFSRTGSSKGVDSAALMALVNVQQTTILGLQATITSLQKSLSDTQASLATTQSLIKTPSGYSNVTIANTPRKIPYY